MEQKYFLRDGKEVYDDNQVEEIERFSAFEHQKAIQRLVNDMEQRLWEIEKQRKA